MYFAIANNLLTLNNMATELGISPRATTTIAWNNFENPKDRSFNMKHHEKCSYTILKSPPEDKWGVMAKAWANKILSMTKMCSC
jgi:hypothetical protein